MYGPITGFDDACAAARALHERFGRGGVMFVLGPAGDTAGLFLAEDRRSADDVRELTPGALDGELAGHDVLYIWLQGDDRLDPTDPAHVDLWYSLVAKMRRRGARLVDCLLVTANDVWSLRMATAAGSGWPDSRREGPAA